MACLQIPGEESWCPSQSFGSESKPSQHLDLVRHPLVVGGKLSPSLVLLDQQPTSPPCQGAKYLPLISERKESSGVQGLESSPLTLRKLVVCLMLSSIKYEFWSQEQRSQNQNPMPWVSEKPRNIMNSYGLSFSSTFWFNSVKIRLWGLPPPHPRLCQSKPLTCISPSLVCKALYTSLFHFNFHNSLWVLSWL